MRDTVMVQKVERSKRGYYAGIALRGTALKAVAG
jgi:hypothetical protein